MKTSCEWNGKMNFLANVNGFKVHMDAAKPIGDETAPTPKELVLVSLCGCTGMDVVAQMKKYMQNISKFNIEAEASVKIDHHHEFQGVSLKYLVNGYLGVSNINRMRICNWIHSPWSFFAC